VTDHPDREQLAAFQAGDGDRRQRADVEAHLAGCSSCAEVVASVERARGRLAVLEEPDLPPGLHDRLAAAVQREAAAATTDGPVSGPSEPGRAVSLDGRRARAARGPRPTPWYRRPVAWGAAAALLLAALVVPLLGQDSDNLTTASGGGTEADTAAQEAAGPGAAAGGQLPVIRVAGEVSAATVRDRLADDTQAKAALDAAAARDRQATPNAAPSQDQPGGEGYRSSAPTPPPQATGGDAGPCLTAATAAAEAATRPLTPAFFIEGTRQGRAATILVTTSAGSPGRVDLWVFPRGDCSSRPLTSERVR
jgi:Putative zinc-finger